MAQKGAKVDSSGEKINSVRIVTDSDADTGIGGVLDPIRVDPTGTTVQPVSFSSAQHVIVDSGGGGGTQYAEGTTQATPTGTVAFGKDPSNVVKSLPITAGGALKVDNSAVTQPVSGSVSVSNFPATQPVSGTVTTTPPANASTNVAQVAGTTADTNSGLKSAGTLRVVLATDQPQLTNKLLVTPDSVALPANQSVNLNQVVGTTADVNSGVKSAGTLRVVLATDQPQLTNKILVTPDANSAVNVAQIGGTSTSVNSGNKDAGTQRVVLASDQPIIPVSLYGLSTAKATYRAGFSATQPSGNVVTLFGSATKTIRLLRVRMLVDSATQTSSFYSIVKCSSAPTGGTATALTKVPLDSANAASTATNCSSYSVVPSGGLASLGALDNALLISCGSTTIAQSGAAERDSLFGQLGQQEVVFRGIAEGITLNLGSPNVIVRGFMEWTEE